jgi:hypothetical protein
MEILSFFKPERCGKKKESGVFYYTYGKVYSLEDA